MERAIVIQLARLGDLVQSAPALEALQTREPGWFCDLLCPAVYADIGACLPGVRRVVPWDGGAWHGFAETGDLSAAFAAFRRLVPAPYALAVNLNNHPRAILAAHAVAGRIVGPGKNGPLGGQLSPWGTYLKRIAAERGANRVHLSDAWCGLCGVRPLGRAPALRLSGLAPIALPDELQAFRNREGTKVAIAVGAGDRERQIPPSAWTSVVAQWLSVSLEGSVVLIGSRGERELAMSMLNELPARHGGRMWDAVGRTTPAQLADILSSCRWVIGSDTGPLHLGAAVGAQAIGWYVARARVHETGPYGDGHWVWQSAVPNPSDWPVAETVDLLCGAMPGGRKQQAGEWQLWRSTVDEWGARFQALDDPNESGRARQDVWSAMSEAGTGAASAFEAHQGNEVRLEPVEGGAAR